MKTIIITESQEKMLIREFMQEGFSLAKLDSIKNLKERIAYCNKYLGEPIGKGSNRTTFEISDDSVIKIANNDIYSQNITEYQNYIKAKQHYPHLLTLFPKVFQIAEDGTWLIAERVMPLTKDDVQNILGLPALSYREPSLMGFVHWAENIHAKELPNSIDLAIGTTTEEAKQTYKKLTTTNPWFKKLYQYIQSLDRSFTDIQMGNLGLALRNNQDTIVIIDTGITNII